MAIMQQRSFVLVPGAGGNAGYWQLVQPLIREAGFSSTAVTLPNWPGATFSDHADAIVAAAGAPNDVTLVAQSMGAFSAPLTCDAVAGRATCAGERHDPCAWRDRGRVVGQYGAGRSHAGQRPARGSRC